MKLLNCASFFAGVGGIDKGFENTGFFKTVYANEFDESPVKTFENNFDLKVDCRDIKKVEVGEIPNFDVMLAGFPCQAFSIAGYQQGFDDKKGRGTLFFELVRILKNKKPQIIFLENVKNLVSHNNGDTFRTILKELQSEGYYVKYAVLNAKEYGNVPQNRERIYITAFKNEEVYKNFDFPLPIPLKTKLSDIIDFYSKMDEKYYYTAGKYKNNLYENAVYQWRRKYVRKNQSGVIPTLTANQGEGGHNVCIIKTRYGIRKMTPDECFYAQGFPKEYKLPNLADSKLYKQAGNSVCVSVIQRIAEKIIIAYKKANLF
jgi:DNA (cytosine-5)-methyltransferase 1